jgi:hypothetical protein
MFGMAATAAAVPCKKMKIVDHDLKTEIESFFFHFSVGVTTIMKCE